VRSQSEKMKVKSDNSGWKRQGFVKEKYSHNFR
jgi:hypothetical protein